MTYPFDCITEFIFVETEVYPADVILVPGADHPPLMEHAAALYHQGYAPYILPSGGYQDHLNRTEWEYLKDIAIEHDVPDTAILQEDQAQNTLENGRFSFDVLEREGIAVMRAILVCKAGHARRALLSYQHEFPKETAFYVSPVVDRYGITKDNWYQSEIGVTRIMREIRKIGTYFEALIPDWLNR
ncbi:YdcF family protein [Paraliobacillus ryukyuensis]|uniref:YdcF family protein n=1 Tax=Paraliobacillus ryukyuensis TaxID=200904 RepID=UPI0009A7EC68|nr:YdcF family protein [Paraliobacillus ryukyuensis]